MADWGTATLLDPAPVAVVGYAATTGAVAYAPATLIVPDLFVTGGGPTVHSGTAFGGDQWAGTAVGVRPAVLTKQGTAAGGYNWAGTAAGVVAVKQGTAAGGYNWAGTAAGVRPTVAAKAGTAAGGYRWAGTAVGDRPAGPPVGTTTTRWTLTEKATGETWTMPINPNSMSGLPMAKQLATANWTREGDRRLRTFQSRTPAEPFEWSGVILTAQHYDDLLAWSRTAGVIVVTDHLQRSFEVIIQSFAPDAKPGRRPTDPKRTYKMSTLFLRRLT